MLKHLAKKARKMPAKRVANLLDDPTDSEDDGHRQGRCLPRRWPTHPSSLIIVTSKLLCQSLQNTSFMDDVIGRYFHKYESSLPEREKADWESTSSDPSEVNRESSTLSSLSV
jgi:hypothetical protein